MEVITHDFGSEGRIHHLGHHLVPVDGFEEGMRLQPCDAIRSTSQTLFGIFLEQLHSCGVVKRG